MSDLQTNLINATTAMNALTQEVANKIGSINTTVSAKIAEMEAWKTSEIIEVTNGVKISKAGNVRSFTRTAIINAGLHPACLTTPEPPSYIKLLELAPGSGGDGVFDISVHKVHRGMGGDPYYEYLEFHGTFMSDGCGGIARRWTNGSNNLDKLYISNQNTLNGEITLPGDGTVVPFTVMPISNSGVIDRSSNVYCLMLKGLPQCGAGEQAVIVCRYTSPFAKPPVTLVTQTRPEYPNLA